jgi:hypothetical protein
LVNTSLNGSVLLQAGCHTGCCLDSGDCDTTCCTGDKWHLECNGGKANAVCDGCFLSTACVVAHGLPDNCEELQTLRLFRDSYLNRSVTGRTAVFRYYLIAPAICKAIYSHDNSRELFCQIYRDLVVKSLQLINNTQYRAAFEHYRDYTLELAERFGVSVPPS